MSYNIFLFFYLFLTVFGTITAPNCAKCTTATGNLVKRNKNTENKDNFNRTLLLSTARGKLQKVI